MSPKTLCNFYREIHRPVYLIGRQVEWETVRAYDRTIKFWEQLALDPPLASIGRKPEGSLILSRWMAAIAERRGKEPKSKVSPATVNCHRRQLYVILHRAESLGLLDSVPSSDPFRECVKMPRFVKESLVNRIYEACGTAKYPEPAPTAFWRGLLVLDWNTGLRKGTILKLPKSSINWRECELDIPPGIIKNRREHRIPLHAVVIKHLQAMKSPNGLLFYWPHAPRTFYRQWQNIQKAAGITPPYYKIHDLRKTCATEMRKHGSSDAAQAMLGHSDFRTTARWYINWAEVLQDIVHKIPQPSSFLG